MTLDLDKKYESYSICIVGRITNYDYRSQEDPPLGLSVIVNFVKIGRKK